MTGFNVLHSNAFQTRFKHREKCLKWMKRIHCQECGYGLESFGKELIQEYSVQELSERKRILEIIDNLYETEAFPEKHPEKLGTLRTIKFLINRVA